MKLHKLISRTVLATALLGATFGGLVAGNNASADDTTPSSDSNMQGSYTQGDSSSVNHNGQSMTKSNGGSTTITNGSLKLNSVPNLEFANQNSSNSNQLSLKSTGILRVTDYRSVDQNNNNGWSLKVTSNGFNTNNGYDENNWTMNLRKTSLDKVSDNNGNDVTPATQINSATLNTNGGQSASQNIVDNNKGKYGITQLTYNGSDATLDVPNVKPDPNNPYTTNMNWDLSTTTDSADN